MTSMAMIFTAIALSQILFVNMIMGFLLLMSMFLMLFGDIIIGYKITASDLKPLLEPTPPGKELLELQLLDGNVRFINTVKGPQGKRSFRMNGHDASIIHDGKAKFRLPGGNVGFRGHELFDQNVDPMRCKALEKMPGDTIKEAFYHFKNKLQPGGQR